MKAKDVLWLMVIALSLLVAWLFIDRADRAKKMDRIIKLLRKEKHEIHITYLNLLKKHLESQQNIDIGIIQEFEKLKTKLDRLDFETHIELETIVKDLKVGRGTEAIRRLSKIVEQKLKKRISKVTDYKGPKMLGQMLEYAKKSNWISEGQYHNSQLLKEIRNKESHELMVIEDSKQVGMCIYFGIDLLYSLKT
ncbi:hypothetical protein GCM10027429_19980 [Marivirga atlantica]|jgi:hypothetical protein|uniref:Uncharacterized protein n=1 Tax=Marivirga atlantica TaxID=1548457 RepID=A0A937AF74_9BACT|nr:hypothetical protein [Marivirga atlantica]MBL0765616.1 hypothetical protein [Marivirga atlantica]